MTDGVVLAFDFGARRIGVATMRFMSLRRRASTIENPIPQTALLMMPIPTRPGTRKSMYREPTSRATSSWTGTGSWRPDAS